MEEHAQNSPQGSLVKVSAVSILVGGVAGLVCAAFRLGLVVADKIRDTLVYRAHSTPILGLILIVIGCAAAAALAAWLVRRFAPHASGSGIPHVEAVLQQELPPAPFRLILVKFVGGLLAIGSGLALGREGPSVQMGASLAILLGRVFRCSLSDSLVLSAGGAGAGLATAFNAPIAGAVFVLEELVRRFDTRTVIVTFGASAGAIAVSRVLLGDQPDFDVTQLPYPSFAMIPACLVMGVLIGLAGALYNRTIMFALATTGRLRWQPAEFLAALVGAIVGLAAWFDRSLVGGGDLLTQRTLAGRETFAWLAIIFLLRFGLGPLSYAARTPGGLFAPMLVLGAQSGAHFGLVYDHFGDGIPSDPSAFAVVGMAAFFTAVVRSPLTGIVLAVELTGNMTLLLPMLSASFTAMLVPTLWQVPPIYESLCINPSPTPRTRHL